MRWWEERRRRPPRVVGSTTMGSAGGGGGGAGSTSGERMGGVRAADSRLARSTAWTSRATTRLRPCTSCSPDFPLAEASPTKIVGGATLQVHFAGGFEFGFSEGSAEASAAFGLDDQQENQRDDGPADE